MDPRFEELDVPFSTADVGELEVAYADRTLTVRFSDFGRKMTTVVFSEVAAYKWDESSFEAFDAQPDRVYQVRDSEWVRRWPASAGFTHFALGFCGLNPVSTGYLEVIAKSMEPRPAS